MLKSTMLKEIQKRLPEGITLVDETDYDFTEDEYLNILCWIKYFKKHLENHGLTEYHGLILSPIVSKRIKLDFAYLLKDTNGGHSIYIIKAASTKTLKAIINYYNL